MSQLRWSCLQPNHHPSPRTIAQAELLPLSQREKRIIKTGKGGSQCMVLPVLDGGLVVTKASSNEKDLIVGF